MSNSGMLMLIAWAWLIGAVWSALNDRPTDFPLLIVAICLVGSFICRSIEKASHKR